MKRRRLQITDVPEEIYASVAEDPLSIFHFLDELQVATPGSAEFMLLCVKLTSPKFDIRFYKNQDDYLTDYTKCLLRGRDDYEFFSFRIEAEEIWDMFLPPPVVGLGIKTKLRPGVDPL